MNGIDLNALRQRMTEGQVKRSMIRVMSVMLFLGITFTQWDLRHSRFIPDAFAVMRLVSVTEILKCIVCFGKKKKTRNLLMLGFVSVRARRACLCLVCSRAVLWMLAHQWACCLLCSASGLTAAVCKRGNGVQALVSPGFPAPLQPAFDLWFYKTQVAVNGI